MPQPPIARHIFCQHPSRLNNLHFTYLTVLRALELASTHLSEEFAFSTGMPREDAAVARQVCARALARARSRRARVHESLSSHHWRSPPHCSTALSLRCLAPLLWPLARRCVSCSRRSPSGHSLLTSSALSSACAAPPTSSRRTSKKRAAARTSQCAAAYCTRCAADCTTSRG